MVRKGMFGSRGRGSGRNTGYETPYVNTVIEPELIERIGSAAQECFGTEAPLEQLAQLLERIAGEKQSENRRGGADLGSFGGRSGARDAEGSDMGARIVSEARRLEEMIPGFSFADALRDETFLNTLRSTGSVSAAYAAMSRSKKRPARAMIAQNGQSAARGTGESSADPSKLESGDFMKYIAKLRNR